MRITGIIPNLTVRDIDASRAFYADYLGLHAQSLGLGWVERYVAGEEHAAVQLVSGDATAPVDSVMSLQVGDDVDEAYLEARRRGYDIVYPLTDEPWGIRRFFVRDPDGNVINVTSHKDQ